MKRRKFIKGMAMTAAFASQPLIMAARRNKKSPIKHFIFVNLSGAPSHMEMFDPKPHHRNGGPTKVVETKTKGLVFAESFKNLAENSNHMAVMRMTSTDANHGTAQMKLQYAGANTGMAGPGTRPSLGAISAFSLGKDVDSGLPKYVNLGGQGMPGGFLGNEYSSYSYGGTNEFEIPEDVRKKVERANKVREKLRELSPLSKSELYQEEVKNEKRALYVIKKGEEVFDTSLESQAVKQKFTGSNGSQFLLVKRLMDFGVSSLQVNIGGWDTHSNNFTTCETKVAALDTALGALVSELKANGKFAETMILICGEFGRTPKINYNEGRDHFANVWNAALISGAFTKGMVFGESSKDGYKIKDGVTLNQLCYSTLELMGTPPRLNEKGKVPERILPSGGGVAGLEFP
jgi:hypothetical protein